MAIPFYEEEENVEHCEEEIGVSESEEEESSSFVGQLVKELVGIYYGKSNNSGGSSRSSYNSRTSNRRTRTSRRLRGEKIMDLLFLGKLRLMN